MPASGPRSRGARAHPRSCQGCQPWPRASATSGLVLATQKLGGITGRASAPSSNTCRLLARDHAAPESTLALAKAARLGREPGRPLAWCSRPRSSAALLEGALMDLAIRSVVLYAFVFILTRVVGRRELSSLQPFDLILLIVLGDSIQQGLTQDDYSVTGAFIVVGMIATLQVATSYVSFRIPRLRPVLH